MLKSAAVAGNREDLSDIITRVSPEETPFLSSIGGTKATNTRTDWQVEALRAPAVNANLEGFAASIEAARAPSRVGTYIQLFKGEGSIANTQQAITTAGTRDLYARAKVNVGLEVKRDKELAYLSNSPSRVENGANARLTAGVLAWASTCTNFGSGGSAGGYNADGTVHAAVPGTARALTVDLFNDVMSKMFAAGAKSGKTALMGYNQKPKFSAFTGIAANRAEVKGTDQATIYNGADVYVGDFGAVTIVPHQFALTNEVVIYNKELIKEATLRPMTSEELPVSGDSKAFLMTNEAGLQVLNEKGIGVIYALTA
jgi:hypothetical protein